MRQEFKELIILIYLNTYEDAYQYSELKELLDFSTSQLKEFIKIMQDKNLLEKSSGLMITTQGIMILKELGLEKVDINELLEKKESLTFSKRNKLEFDDIYIPKNFKL